MHSVRHLLTGGAPLALGVAGAWASLQLPLGSATRPGPGMWPLVVSLALVVCSAVVLVVPEEGQEAFTRRSLPIGAVIVALAAFVLLFSSLGFVLPAALLLAGWLRFISRENWRMTAAVTVTAVVVLYLLFEVALGVPFPYDFVTGR